MVVDASVLVELIGPGPFAEEVAPLFDPGRAIEHVIPDLCPLEVASALRRRVLEQRGFPLAELRASVEQLLRLGPTIVPSVGFLVEAVRFARELTVYDAIYLAVAQSLGIPLCTFDGGLARQARRAGVAVLHPGTAAFERWLGQP